MNNEILIHVNRWTIWELLIPKKCYKSVYSLLLFFFRFTLHQKIIQRILKLYEELSKQTIKVEE